MNYWCYRNIWSKDLKTWKNLYDKSYKKVTWAFAAVGLIEKKEPNISKEKNENDVIDDDNSNIRYSF